MDVIYKDDTMVMRLQHAIVAAARSNRRIARFELTRAEFQQLKKECDAIFYPDADHREWVPDQFQSIPITVK